MHVHTLCDTNTFLDQNNQSHDTLLSQTRRHFSDNSLVFLSLARPASQQHWCLCTETNRPCLFWGVVLQVESSYCLLVSVCVWWISVAGCVPTAQPQGVDFCLGSSISCVRCDQTYRSPTRELQIQYVCMKATLCRCHFFPCPFDTSSAGFFN